MVALVQQYDPTTRSADLMMSISEIPKAQIQAPSEQTPEPPIDPESTPEPDPEPVADEPDPEPIGLPPELTPEAPAQG